MLLWIHKRLDIVHVQMICWSEDSQCNEGASLFCDAAMLWTYSNADITSTKHSDAACSQHDALHMICFI